MSRPRFAALVCSLPLLLVAGSAWADAPAAPAAPAPAPAAAPAAPAAAAPPAAPAAEAPKAPAAKPWYEVVKIEAFADGYFSHNLNAPKPQAGTNGGRAFDNANGFSLAWVGLNASVAAEPVGGTVSLRWGPSTVAYTAGTDAAAGLANVKQAFASWKPGGKEGKLTLDFGKFDQPFGSEVADSQYNINYTRSLLYWYAQPLYFTGLRADYAATDTVDLKLFLVNGWNATIDNNASKSVAFQLNLKPSDTLLVALGAYAGAEQSDFSAGDPTATPPTAPAEDSDAGSRYRILGDVVVDWAAAPTTRVLFNGDYGTEKIKVGGEDKTVKFYGANLALRQAFGDEWSAAVRGGYFADPDGFAVSGFTAAGKKHTLVDATATLGYTPTPNLVLKLDLRMDKALDSEGAEDKVFAKKVGEGASAQTTATLGVVVTTN